MTSARNWSAPEAEESILARVEGLQIKLAIDARYWAARFSGPVWLVGSVLHSPTPRDIDVRVLVQDDEFAARYGHELVQKDNPYHDRPEITSAQCVDWDKDGPSQRWVDDMAKFNSRTSVRTRKNIDLQVWPESHWRTPYPSPVLLAAPSPRWFFHTKFADAQKGGE